MYPGEKEFWDKVNIDKNLFAIEGGEFSGKSSVCDKLKGDFRIARLPGATEIGEKVREILKNRSIKRSPDTDYFLLCACDAEFFRNERHLITDKILLDRSFISRIIYQGTLGNIEFKRIFEDILFAWNEKIPCKTAILTCSNKTLKERMKNRQSDDWFDSIAEVTNNLYKNFAQEHTSFVKEICTDDLAIDQVAQKVKDYFLYTN